MRIYMKDGEVIDATPMMLDEIKDARRSKSESARVFWVDGVSKELGQVRLIGEPCLNQECHRQERAHPKREVCDFELTGECEVCQKKMYERDRSYMKKHFGSVACRKHSFWGEADRLLPGDRQDKQLTQLRAKYVKMRKRGLTEEEATNKITS